MKTLTIACITAALLLSGCVSKQKYADQEKHYQELTQAMSAELGAKDVKISRMQDAIKLSINSELLFPSGEWEVSEKAKSTLTKVVTTLAPYQTTKILVKGYTDNTPIGPGLAKQGVTSNQILSQKRADSVMQLMISKGANPSLISAQGVGEAEPVASNDTPEGRAQNRRVELTLAPKE